MCCWCSWSPSSWCSRSAWSRRSRPAASQAQGNPYQIVLAIAADGTFTLNGHAVPDADLERTLTAIYRDRPSKVLFIKAAGERSYQDVVRVIDRAKGAGVQIVAIVPRGR